MNFTSKEHIGKKNVPIMAKGGDISNLKGTWVNRKSGQRWRVDYVYEEDKEVVLVKLTGKPLTRVITIESLLKNWEKSFDKGGLTPEKAQIMLDDGIANKKPLTPKQKKYFHYVAKGEKGGEIKPTLYEIMDHMRSEMKDLYDLLEIPKNPSNKATLNKEISDVDNSLKKLFYSKANLYPGQENEQIINELIRDYYNETSQKKVNFYYHEEETHNKYWEIVESANFKAWFGDWENHPASSSKVMEYVPEFGYNIPAIVFHGTQSPNLFYRFKFDKFPVMYFAEKLSYAKWFSMLGTGVIYNVFLNVKRPADLTALKTDQFTWEEMVAFCYGTFGVKLPEKHAKAPKEAKGAAWMWLRSDLPDQNLIKAFKEKGYDGFRMIESNEADLIDGKPNETVAWAVFDSNQIKSATYFHKDTDQASKYNDILPVLYMAKGGDIFYESAKRFSDDKLERSDYSLIEPVDNRPNRLEYTTYPSSEEPNSKYTKTILEISTKMDEDFRNKIIVYQFLKLDQDKESNMKSFPLTIEGFNEATDYFETLVFKSENIKDEPKQPPIGILCPTNEENNYRIIMKDGRNGDFEGSEIYIKNNVLSILVDKNQFKEGEDFFIDKIPEQEIPFDVNAKRKQLAQAFGMNNFQQFIEYYGNEKVIEEITKDIKDLDTKSFKSLAKNLGFENARVQDIINLITLIIYPERFNPFKNCFYLFPIGDKEQGAKPDTPIDDNDDLQEQGQGQQGEGQQGEGQQGEGQQGEGQQGEGQQGEGQQGEGQQGEGQQGEGQQGEGQQGEGQQGERQGQGQEQGQGGAGGGKGGTENEGQGTEPPTLQFKDKVAQEFGFSNWENLLEFYGTKEEFIKEIETYSDIHFNSLANRLNIKPKNLLTTLKNI